MYRAVGIGGGGHAKVVIEILRAAAVFDPVALVDSNSALWGTEVLGVPVVGGDEALTRLFAQGYRHAFIGIGSSGDISARQQALRRAEDLGFLPAQAIHPSAEISASAKLSGGITVMARAVVNACTAIGANAIINTGAVVDHDCQIGDDAHVGPGAHLAGGVVIGAGAHVGIGATILQSIRIGSGAIVGAGAVVTRDIPASVVAVGVPARRVREVRP